MSVKQEERSRVLARIFLIHFQNQLRAERDQRIVFSGRLARVRQVAEEREVNVGIVVSQIPHLQGLDQPSHLFFIQEQSRDSDHGRAVVRNRVCEIELWKNFRGQNRSNKKIDQLHCALRTRQEQEQHRKYDESKRSIGIGQKYDRHGH